MKTVVFLLMLAIASISLAQDAGPEYVSIPERSRLSQLMNNMEAHAPILAAHPTNVPPGGFFYRITGTNNVTKLFFAREDGLSTQLSAHNDAGEEVTCTFNLFTRIERTINLLALCRAKKFADMQGAEIVKTNRASAR